MLLRNRRELFSYFNEKSFLYLLGRCLQLETLFRDDHNTA
jgi:hypothetical protein